MYMGLIPISPFTFGSLVFREERPYLMIRLKLKSEMREMCEMHASQVEMREMGAFKVEMCKRISLLTASNR